MDKLSGSVIKNKLNLASSFLAAGLVERVVLLGAPISIEEENWTDARKVVEFKIYIYNNYWFTKFLCKLCCCTCIILTIPLLDLFPVACFYFFPNYDCYPMQVLATVLTRTYSGSQMVAGRFVNAYSISDWTLGIAFRARYRPYFLCLVLALRIFEGGI